MFKRLLRILKKTLRIKKIHSKKRKKTHRRKILHKRRNRPRRIAKRRLRLARRKLIRKQRKLKRTPQRQLLGVVTHYFPKVNAAVVKLKKPLALGVPIWIKGKTTDFRQTVGSMQIDRNPIEKARPGQEIGLEVFREVRPGDIVYRSGK